MSQIPTNGHHPISSRTSRPTLLAFIPHPDDEAYAFGGTIARAADAGWRCVIACASSGERGERYDGQPSDPEALAQVREAELAESCSVLGAEQPLFWRLPDRELASCGSQAFRVHDVITAVDPDVILTLGADGAYGHPDHIALHRWVIEGWDLVPREFRPPVLLTTFPRGLFVPQYELCRPILGDPPELPPTALGADVFDVEVDVAQHRERKLRALAAHRTQLPAGDPLKIFPEGLVEQLLDAERFMLMPGLRRGAPLPGQRVE